MVVPDLGRAESEQVTLADVDRRSVLLARDPRVSQDEIHIVLPTAGRL